MIPLKDLIQLKGLKKADLDLILKTYTEYYK